jgi:PQQ-dependent catabolism-associated CXXCW motif protein
MLGREVESIEFQQRALNLGKGSSPVWRAQRYNMIACAHALSGRPRDAQLMLAEANVLWPFATVRNPVLFSDARGIPDAAYLVKQRAIQDSLGLAGLRDHAEEDADFGLLGTSELHPDLIGRTPTSVPGTTTINTSELVDLLTRQKPILIDVALDSWGRSLPGAVGLQGTGHGTRFSNGLQARFTHKIQDLTQGDLSTPIVVFCTNSERFTGYNLALRLAALGCTNVYWYRGGVEAWQVNGLPENELELHSW